MAAELPTPSQIQVRVSGLKPLGTRVATVLYRSSTPRYATEDDLLTGIGSQRCGGRWNPVGLAAVYASLTPETALAETLAHHRYYNLPLEQAMPRTFVAIEARLRLVLDLGNGQVRQRLRLSLASLLAVDWRRDMAEGRIPLTQVVGWAADLSGFEGVLVPSSADPTGVNLLVFPRKLRPGSRLEILSPERL
jgi:RES domain-containing protein